MKKMVWLLLWSLLWSVSPVTSSPADLRFSVAGFYPLEGTGRSVYSMNPAWRFLKGDAKHAEAVDFDDTGWSLVSLPNGLELLPTEASGCINYQGPAWYRKHFTPETGLRGKRLFLHFEAIMGKSKIWINGQLVKKHFGGYLPIVMDITPYVNFDKDNVIAVYADNSDDPDYPPGKPQASLDFTYCGGIYRDCWLIAHNNVYITDPNYEDTPAGGGLFVSFDAVSDAEASLRFDLQIRNMSRETFKGKVFYELFDRNGRKVRTASVPALSPRDSARTVTAMMTVRKPYLWSPESPYLYNLYVYVKDSKGRVVDGYRRRVGIRSIEFKGKDGFWLNGKPYPSPVIGANRHQDFAVVGNAVSNSMHWRDAKKLRDAGLKAIRNAHSPQDPAFMDACDELGLLVIVNTPGWQFWNNKPVFAQRVYSDIRQMVRRDRNHPCIWMWEPVLNETWYPNDFAKRTVDIIKEEYPFKYCYSACDATARGHEHFPILFTHAPNGGGGDLNTEKSGISYYTREWGDNVDDWNSHNSPSRASRAWGEVPMLVQAQTYADLPYKHTCFETLYSNSRQFMGGCLWHSFDHQRGYHPDPFYGGIMDAFRQPKYSYYLFCAQRPAVKDTTQLFETGPMVYIAHAMTPFSPADVTVYSNCDEVRLTVFKGGRQLTYKRPVREQGMPSPIITFKDVWHVIDDKQLSRSGKQSESFLLAEGLMDGKVVATHKVMPARRPSKVMLFADKDRLEMKADGSDQVTVIAAITDDKGNVKRLNNDEIRFEIEGEGELLGNAHDFTNPRPVQWGTAPILVRSTTTPGTIKIRAMVTHQGKQMPLPGELVITTHAADYPFVANPKELATEKAAIELRNRITRKAAGDIDEDIIKENRKKLKEVEKQQSDFE